MTSNRRKACVIRTVLVLFAAAAGFAASCDVGQATGSKPAGPVFPHEYHLTTVGAACADCHTTGGVLPKVEVCQGCHAEATEHVTPAQVAQIMSAAKPVEGAHGLVFDHARHTGMACGDCHKTAGATVTRPAMSTCMDNCHGPRAQAPLGCNTCHRTLDDRGRPADHRVGWERHHGETARASQASCKSCHQSADFCQKCHQQQTPRDHNQAWRLRTHGVVAQMDRERCQTCHRQDYCVRCHLGTQPINHTNAWKGGATRHCANCHLPLSTQRCAVCHLSASHPAAPSWPTGPTHVSGANCRGCHMGPGAGLNHTDNGDNCETCHAK